MALREESPLTNSSRPPNGPTFTGRGRRPAFESQGPSWPRSSAMFGYAAFATAKGPTRNHAGLPLLLLWLCIEKVIHHRDDDGHALHHRDVCCVGQYG